jgi:hypothetical protein
MDSFNEMINFALPIMKISDQIKKSLAGSFHKNKEN